MFIERNNAEENIRMEMKHSLIPTGKPVGLQQ